MCGQNLRGVSAHWPRITHPPVIPTYSYHSPVYSIVGLYEKAARSHLTPRDFVLGGEIMLTVLSRENSKREPKGHLGLISTLARSLSPHISSSHLVTYPLVEGLESQGVSPKWGLKIFRRHQAPTFCPFIFSFSSFMNLLYPGTHTDT